MMDGPVVWTVSVPPGWKAAPADNVMRPAAGMTAALNLHRAAALLTFSRQLTEGGRERGPAAAEALPTAQFRFHQFCLEAGHILDLSGEGVNLTGPGGQALRTWLQDLLAGNQELSSQQGFEEVRAEAERNARAEKSTSTTLHEADDSTPAGRGTPVFTQATADAATPLLQLVPETRHWAKLLVSAQWLAVAAVVWGLSFFPAWALHLRPFWPEQVLLFGLLGWYLAGPTLAVLFLLVLGASGRLVLFGSWASTRLHRPLPQAGSGEQPRQ
jgi:hypothetical protein